MRYLMFLAVTVVLFSCKKEDATLVNDAVTNIKENTKIIAKEASGKITLNCNGKQIIADGICGGVITMGTLTIAVKDKINPTKVFTIDFNTDQYPENGKEYNIKPKDYSLDKNPENEVSVSFLEGLPNHKMNVWDSQTQSGKIRFLVNENVIKCTFKEIKLQPNTTYNSQDLQKEGVLSGELTLYKN